mmetsp:Transcript_17048/g.34117  ORF Transcript_17048/g.34117 Transcript_17048/m.34117 type:complete len:244 (+) Transcript_17048:130-861(+)
MDAFSKEMLRVGTLRGFMNFSCYLRGREELLITISKRPTTEIDNASAANPTVPLQAMSPAKPINSDPTGKPPASPAARDALTANSSETECVYLLGAYQRYKSPFVWLRGGNLDQYSGEDRDVPLKLQTTTDWVKHKAHVWDVIAELVALTIRPRPENPFAVDFGLLETIPLVQSTLCSAALLSTLHEILSEGVSVLDAALMDDMQRLTEMHFMGLRALAEDVADQEEAEEENRRRAEQDPGQG